MLQEEDGGTHSPLAMRDELDDKQARSRQYCLDLPLKAEDLCRNPLTYMPVVCKWRRLPLTAPVDIGLRESNSRTQDCQCSNQVADACYPRLAHERLVSPEEEDANETWQAEVQHVQKVRKETVARVVETRKFLHAGYHRVIDVRPDTEFLERRTQRPVDVYPIIFLVVH